MYKSKLDEVGYTLTNSDTGETWHCSFFNWERGFSGHSLKAIYKLNELFDRSLIQKDDNGLTYDEYIGI